MSEINEVASVACVGEMQLRIGRNESVTPIDAARILGISDRTLRDWRDRHYGPRPHYTRIWGFSWSYQLRDIYEFLIFQQLEPNRARW